MGNISNSTSIGQTESLHGMTEVITGVSTQCATNTEPSGVSRHMSSNWSAESDVHISIGRDVRKISLDFEDETSYNNIVSHTYQLDCDYSKWPYNDYKYLLTHDKDCSTMSIITASHFNESIIIASDTRSTSKLNMVPQYDDAYKKIAFVPNSNIMAISSGMNEFGDKNFEQLISTVRADDISTVAKQIAEIINPVAQKREMSTIVALFQYVGAYPVGLSCEFNGSSKITNIDVAHCWGCFYAAGVEWAYKLMTEEMDFMAAQDNPVPAIHSAMKAIITLSAYKKGDYGKIGGNVDMAVLKPGCAPEFLPQA
jgi:hypothetical protein